MGLEEEFNNKIKKFKQSEQQLLLKSYYFAKQKHSGQKRKTNEDFINHPLRVTLKLLEWDDYRIDINAYCASLVHDVLEDTDCSIKELKSTLNKNIASLALQLTSISSSNIKEDLIILNNLLKYGDTRALIIKISDRLDNLKTAHVLGKNRLKEVLEVDSTWTLNTAKGLNLLKAVEEIQQTIKFQSKNLLV